MILTVGNQNKGVVKSLKAKTWMIMKLTIVLLLFFTFQVSAKSNAQKITIVKNNIHLSEVFRDIEKQTGYLFFYDKVLVKNTAPIDIAVKDATIDQALSACLKGEQLTYTIVRNTIVIGPKEKKTHFQTQATLALTGSTENPPLQIHGIVRDENGNPLENASVIIKGTNRGATTDNAGNFTISVPNAQTVLIISFTGYKNQEILVGNRTTININLTRGDKALNEVVVTALGIKREARTLGYSTAAVSHDEVAQNRTNTTMGTLQGKVSGVNITSLGTGPQGSTRIRIRGNSSFSGANTPLIVVDGTPINNSQFGSQGLNNSDGGDGLSSINPDDIESMTVLKGAAAAALYGSRAKDGVIMITTKLKGKGKAFGVEYNSNFTIDTPLDYTDFQYEYGQGEKGIRPTQPFPTSGIWSFGEKFEPGMTQVLFDSVVVPYVPIHDRTKQFYEVGTNFSNTVSLSNNNEKGGGFNLSFSNLDSKSIVPNSHFNRKIINLGFIQPILKNLTVQGNINYSNEYNKNPAQVGGQEFSTPSSVYTIANSMPFDLLKKFMVDSNGNETVYARFLPRTNPYFSAYEHFENIRRDRFFGNLSVKYDLTKWLYLQGRIAQDYYNRPQDYNYPTGYAAIGPAPVGFVNGSYFKSNTQFRERNYDFLLGANRKVGKVGIDLTFGGNQMYRREDVNNESAQDFIQRGLYTIMNGRVKNASYTVNERKVNSLYGAAEFSFRNYLFLNVTGRNDWFSTLSPSNRSIFYPSATGSFVFSDAFDKMPRWLSFGKLRAGYAQVGDDNVAPYSNVLTYTVNPNLYPNSNDGLVPVGGITATTIPNTNLRPLRLSEAEIGINLGLLDNVFNLDLSVYRRISQDQIVSSQISTATGFASQLINVGRSMNKGIEAALTVTPVKSASFRWDINANVSYNTSKVLQLGLNPEDSMISIGGIREVVGKPMGQIYTYMYLRDAKGRQVFDKNSGFALRTSDPIDIGSNQPAYFGGITNTFNYKGITLLALIDFKAGKNYKMLGGSNRNYWRHGLHKGTLPGRDVGYVIGDGVNPDGNENTTKAQIQPFYENVTGLNIYEPFISKAGFWKLRQVSLSYDFIKFLSENSFLKGLRLSLVANNVLVLKKWAENMDPEEVYGYSDNNNGSGWSSLPLTRSIGFNLNVRF